MVKSAGHCLSDCRFYRLVLVRYSSDQASRTRTGYADLQVPDVLAGRHTDGHSDDDFVLDIDPPADVHD
ncbi:hypothetical protein D3C85_1674350 [compost metagenome]